MKRKIISGPEYCAVMEDGKLMEYIPYNAVNQSGAILLGRIDRMMPGMHCAFADIGRKKSGFLPMNEESSSFTGAEIRSGETLLLQIKKEEIGEKGAFLTRDITLAGRLVILMPMNRYIGVSARIKDEDARKNLKAAGEAISQGRYGLVMRNAAVDKEEKEIREEAEELFAAWEQIRAQSKDGGNPGTIFRIDDPLNRLKEDYAAAGFEAETERLETLTEIHRQLKQASERLLCLPGGGNIVIDRCEAMTVIDVNTASCTGNGTKEKTVLETNLEACSVIAQQTRLRNLGGIILIDFIDMQFETDRSLVLDKLADCFTADRTKTVIHGWTRLGLMEMTRKRTGKETKTEG